MKFDRVLFDALKIGMINWGDYLLASILRNNEDCIQPNPNNYYSPRPDDVWLSTTR